MIKINTEVKVENEESNISNPIKETRTLLVKKERPSLEQMTEQVNKNSNAWRGTILKCPVCGVSFEKKYNRNFCCPACRSEYEQAVKISQKNSKPKVQTYIKKPIPIQALQWTGNNLNDIYNFANVNCMLVHSMGKSCDELVIHTLEGDMIANKGDYIIKGIKGEFYPCKPDIFEESYQEV